MIAAGVLAAALSLPPAAAVPAASTEAPMLDPWVPPATRAKALREPVPVATRGEALKAQVEGKLRSRFEAAAGPAGALTLGQAKASGLGFIANHFAAIDRQGDGRVTLDEYLEFLRSR
jgi:hypothetical protein